MAKSKRIKLVDKKLLSTDQLLHVKKRLSDPIHKEDSGPINVWETYQHFLYAVVCLKSGLPIGLVEASGRPIASPGWWIDSDYRNQGYGKETVDALAELLICDGVEEIRSISVQGQYHEYSARLVDRLRQRFDSLKQQS